MIDGKSFKNTKEGRKLKKLYRGDMSKVDPTHVDKLLDYMTTLNSSSTMDMIKALGEDYHPWPNTKKGAQRVHSVTVDGNNRLLFQFDKGRGYFFNLEYGDFHK